MLAQNSRRKRFSPIQQPKHIVGIRNYFSGHIAATSFFDKLVGASATSSDITCNGIWFEQNDIARETARIMAKSMFNAKTEVTLKWAQYKARAIPQFLFKTARASRLSMSCLDHYELEFVSGNLGFQGYISRRLMEARSHYSRLIVYGTSLWKFMCDHFISGALCTQSADGTTLWLESLISSKSFHQEAWSSWEIEKTAKCLGEEKRSRAGCGWGRSQTALVMIGAHSLKAEDHVPYLTPSPTCRTWLHLQGTSSASCEWRKLRTSTLVKLPKKK